MIYHCSFIYCFIMQRIVRFITIVFCLFLINQQNGFCQSNTKTNVYQNPVFAHDFPDPNLVKSPDGYFYAYSTQSNWKRDSLSDSTHFIPILRSKDLTHWSYVGDALKTKPNWKKEGGIWAPDITLYKGKYYLYYSYSTWGDPNPGVGFAVSIKPGGPFVDK